MNSLIIKFEINPPDEITLPIPIEEINKLTYEEFLEVFGNIVENVKGATHLVHGRCFHNLMDLYCAFCDLLDHANTRSKKLILKLNPGLRQHLPILTGLTSKDKKLLSELIFRYERKFGFAFVICEKEKNTDDIVEAFLQRFQNTKHAEIRNGIEEVKKIIKYRILQLIKHEYA